MASSAVAVQPMGSSGTISVGRPGTGRPNRRGGAWPPTGADRSTRPSLVDGHELERAAEHVGDVQQARLELLGELVEALAAQPAGDGRRVDRPDVLVVVAKARVVLGESAAADAGRREQLGREEHAHDAADEPPRDASGSSSKKLVASIQPALDCTARSRRGRPSASRSMAWPK